MKLLIEMAEEQDVESLVEDTKHGKRYFLEGKWGSVNEMVKNGRIYEHAVWAPALKKYNEEFISQKRALGELNHPAGPTVNLDRVSHLIENLRIDGNNVLGRARVLESTPMGAIAKSLIDEGVKLGVSTRGLGSIVTRGGKNYVGSDFMLNAIDIVSNPSGNGCFVNGIMESVDYQMLEDGRIIQLVVDAAKNRIDESKAIKAFSALMESFKSR